MDTKKGNRQTMKYAIGDYIAFNQKGVCLCQIIRITEGNKLWGYWGDITKEGITLDTSVSHMRSDDECLRKATAKEKKIYNLLWLPKKQEMVIDEL